MKGLFHDFKFECLDKEEYHSSTPISLYSIERGSAIWDFLMSYYYVIPTVYYLSLGIVKFKGALLDNEFKELQIKKLESELEKINKDRKQKSQAEISRDSLDKFVDKHYFPIENLVKQNIKQIKVISSEKVLGLEYYSRTEIISIEFSDEPKDIEGPTLSI